MRRLELSVGPERFEATVLEAAAPQTCASVWRMLPFSGELVHAHFIGPALTAEIAVQGVPGENPYAIAIPPGAILLDIRQQPVALDGRRLPPEIVIVYETGARLLNWAGFSPANYFAHIAEGRQRLTAIGRRIAVEGVSTLTIRALS